MNSTTYLNEITITLDENQLITLCEMVSNNNRYLNGFNVRTDMVEVSRILRDALKEIK